MYEPTLSHYGKLGMRWGVRKEASTISTVGTSTQKKGWSTKKKVGVGIAGAIAVGGTAYAIHHVLQGNGKVPVQSMREQIAHQETIRRGQIAANEIQRLTVFRETPANMVFRDNTPANMVFRDTPKNFRVKSAHPKGMRFRSTGSSF